MLKRIQKIKKDLSLITGQSPVVRMSKKAIASFKVRKGMPVGLSVTLRKNMMMEFYDRYLNEEDIDFDDDGRTKISDKMGYISSVDNAREMLENLYKLKDNKES